MKIFKGHLFITGGLFFFDKWSEFIVWFTIKNLYLKISKKQKINQIWNLKKNTVK